MRTILAWAYYSVSAGWQVGVFILWVCVLLGACYGWTRTVDEFALQVSRRAEQVTTGKVTLNFGYSHLYQMYRGEKSIAV
jgi:Zn-dependent protease